MSYGFELLPKLFQIKLQVPHMQEARFNSRWRGMDLEAPVCGFIFSYFFLVEKVQVCLECRVSKGQAQAFGSVDQADDRRELSTQ